ncbi:MAG: gluconate 2-dehydrogenase subunit 3 family protein [Verrucomicrobia bacterium]|nr:gluconate 2-dehydrogenase subunit 3 family protein [Verrucomicrobiota bacterium]
MKWFAAAAAASAIPEFTAGTATPNLGAATPPATKGYGTDTNTAGYFKPGDVWPLTLPAAQRKLVTALADVILPADHLGPAASEVHVPEMMDEWISAPYPDQQKDRAKILPGLQWIEDESHKRFQKSFTALTSVQQHAICDDICTRTGVKKEFSKGAEFFGVFRNLAASAYYSTEPGWHALGYVGNVPLTQFDGPPREVLEKLGVTQTVV